MVTPIHTPPPCQQRACDQQGQCRGRKVPCLSCTRPGVAPWPDEDDGCTVWEWLTGPLLLAAVLGVIGGVIYGAVRHVFPHLLS